MKPRGFTLLELLVVIAIIGLLSAVVIASLASARTKANDSAGKETLHSLRLEMSRYFTENGTYGTSAHVGMIYINSLPAFVSSCATDVIRCDQKVNDIVTSISRSTGGAPQYFVWSIGQSGQTYAVEVIFKSGMDYCIDSTGASKVISSSFTLGGGSSATAQCP